jgi:hypothetical protein
MQQKILNAMNNYSIKLLQHKHNTMQALAEKQSAEKQVLF